MENQRYRPGGVIHSYQKYDPQQFPSPASPPPDLVSPAFEHALMYGRYRELTAEELARAIHLDPSQIKGLGPSLDTLRAMLEERKQKILATYETRSVEKKSRKLLHKASKQVQVPKQLTNLLERALRSEQPYELERLWYRIGDDQSPAAHSVLNLMGRMSDKHQIEELVTRYTFTGIESLTVPEALAVKQELEQIDALLKQLEEAAKTAQIGLIDMEMLAQFAEPGDLNQLDELRQAIENYVREEAQRQGMERDPANQASGFRLTPKAYKLFQGKLLERIFSDLQPSRSGRHQGNIVGEGAVELQQTKAYEFGDAVANMDLPQTVVNALIRQGGQTPLQLRTSDIEIHKTRNHPRCATVVLIDMSGSMRYDGQYMNVKRMALALQGLIQTEYPGDFLRFIEMATFAKPTAAGEIIELMPKPVTIHDPWVRLKVDMSDDGVSEYQIPPHFTNIQHALQLARRQLVNADTPNKQIILITDGLPTAHFEDSWLYMLYPPDPRTEIATMREGAACAREGIVINLFLIPSWSQSEEDIRFAYRLAESTKGRVFFTSGKDLDRYVVWDYHQQRRDIIG